MNADDVVSDVRMRMIEKKARSYSEPGRRGVRRPEEILRDVRGLKLRQRVSLVLGDQILREELEDSIKNSTVNGVTRLDTIRTYQDFLLPALQPSLVSSGHGHGGAVFLPINDMRGESKLEYSKSERILRCKQAAVYRLIDIFGWSEAIFNHVSVRPQADKDEFLLNAFGLLFSEVTASSLVKCDVEGTILDGGSTCLGINKAGFVLHSAIHEARPDIGCVIHVHTPPVVAIASMKCGFLRISQESLIVGDVSYHDYCGILVDEAEKESIKKDLGKKNMVMFLRNHGVVVCGKTIEDAFMLLCNLMEACETQVKSVSVGVDNLNIISDEAYDQVQKVMENAAQNVIKGEGKKRMSVSEYYFEAYMRWLDSQGYRTGYLYHMPDVFLSAQRKKYPKSRVPPQATSDRDTPYQAYFDYQNSMPVQRAHSMGGRGNTHRNKVKWLNKPVQSAQYVKEEEQESKPVEICDEKVLNGLMSGHNEEVTNTEEENFENGTKVVTKTKTKTTTTVTKRKVVTEVPEDEDKVFANVTNTANEPTNADHVLTEKVVINGEESKGVTSLSKSAGSLNPPSESGSFTDHLNRDNNGSKSPQKVKKQKSFKKAFMKKLHKKDEKSK